MTKRAALLASVLCGTSFLVTLTRPARAGGPSADGSPATQIGGGKVWRAPRYDGANSLYLFLRLHGIRVAYADVARLLGVEVHRSCFADLATAARTIGLSSEVYRCTPAELERDGRPVISLMDASSEGNHGFVVLLNFTGSRWQYIDGATAEVHEISRDAFRRTWSGFILAPRRMWPSWLSSLSGGVAVVAGYRVVKVLRARRPINPAPARCA